MAASVDPRQIVAGVLTLTMFLMLADMIKRDYYPSPSVSASPQNIHDANKVSVAGLEIVAKGDDDDGGSASALNLNPCWHKPVLDEADESRGYVTFSLTNGPEFHVSQIANAVVVARHLQATLVIPDVIGITQNDESDFEYVYDVEKFMEGLEGAVKVVKSLPSGISAESFTLVKVPNRVTIEHIAENIEPLFKEKGNIRIVTYFPSVNMKKSKERTNLDSLTCLAMFGTLEPQIEVREVIDSMVTRLKAVSRKSSGKFVAVDLRMDMLEKKGCQERLGSRMKSCYGPKEVALFLKNIGFDKDTTVYVTQTNWHNSLYALKDYFPKTYTKDSIMPLEGKKEFLTSGTTIYEKVIDYYICSESDVFVPAISGLFYANVAGKRIASGRTQILVPAEISASAKPQEFLSQYISKKNHIAYSCFC